jgi:hypothetical protein
VLGAEVSAGFPSGGGGGGAGGAAAAAFMSKPQRAQKRVGLLFS